MSQYRVVERISRPTAAELAPLQAARAATIGRFLGAGQCMDPGIQALKRGWKVVGPAVTVTMDDASVLLPQLAIDLAQPGDVIVVAAHGQTATPSWGGGMTVWSEKRGLAGAVVDGAVGGADPILARDWPVFCRGTSPRFALPNVPGSVNVPVVCGGVLVNPGDVVIGNSDGVVVVPRGRIPDVVAELEALDASLDRAGVRGGGSLLAGSDLKQVLLSMPIEWQDGVPAVLRGDG